MRTKLRNVSLLALLIVSFLLLSIAIDSLGDVPKYIPLPRPPFVNQSSDFVPGVIDGDIPIGWDEPPKLVGEEATQIDPSCGCEGMPLFNITGVTGTQYLRVKLGESYSGEWLMYNSTSLPYAGEAINAKIGEARKIYISPEGSFKGYIPAMKNTQQLAGPPNLEYFPEKMIFHSDKEVECEYEISYNIEDFHPDDLMKEYLSYNVRYLQVPYDVQAAVENMTRDIVAGIETDYLKIKAIESYLRDNYVYTLNYTRSSDDMDPVLWFLFVSKEGVCIHYNSALVLMARSIGLPMRLVTGYRIDPDKHIQTVTPQQAHAWAEASFEDQGWVTFDATGRMQEGEEMSEDHGALTPTNTSIIYQDSSCYKNDKFVVTGRVTDADGKPVNGLTTLIYLVTEAPKIVLWSNTETVIWRDIEIDIWDEASEELFLDGILCGKTVSKDDQFTVNCTIPINTQPKGYGVKAVTLGNSVYEGSNTDPPLVVLAHSTIECNTSIRVISGKRFTIEGKLLEEGTGIPLSVHDLDVILEKRPYSRLFADDEGIFRYNHVFEPGTNQIILNWEGTLYYNGTRKILNVTAIPLSIDPDPVDYLVRGETNHITGKVHAEELIPDPGEQVEIYLDHEFIGTTATDENGFFRHSYTIPDSTAVGEVQLSYYLFDDALRQHTTSQPSIVAIRPTLNYLPRGVGTWKKPFQIEAVIQNDRGEPMRNVDLRLISENTSQTLSTDENGRVFFDVFLESRPGEDLYEFQIEFTGSKYVIPVKVQGSIQLSAVINYLGWFLWFFKVSAVFGMVYGIYVLAGRRYPGIVGLNFVIDAKEIKEEEEEIETGVYIIRSDKARILVEIIDIEDALPLVWGVHEPFTLKIEVKSEKPKTRFCVEVDGLEDIKSLSVEDGVASEVVAYHSKGLKNISFIYEDIEERIYAETLLVMRVVDYREEIAEQFKRDFKAQVEKNKSLNERLTAREMLQVLSTEPDSICLEALNMMVINFEEATYSHHPITAENYREYIRSRNALEVSENAG